MSPPLHVALERVLGHTAAPGQQPLINQTTHKSRSGRQPAVPSLAHTPSQNSPCIVVRQPNRLMQGCKRPFTSPKRALSLSTPQPLPTAPRRRSVCTRKASRCKRDPACRSMSAAEAPDANPAAAAVAAAAAAAAAAAEVPPVDDQLVARALQRHPRIILGTGSSSRRGGPHDGCLNCADGRAVPALARWAAGPCKGRTATLSLAQTVHLSSPAVCFLFSAHTTNSTADHSHHNFLQPSWTSWQRAMASPTKLPRPTLTRRPFGTRMHSTWCARGAMGLDVLAATSAASIGCASNMLVHNRPNKPSAPTTGAAPGACKG